MLPQEIFTNRYSNEVMFGPKCYYNLPPVVSAACEPL